MKVTHSKMLTTRRRKKKGQKQLSLMVKRAKKLGKANAKLASAAAAKEGAA